MYVYVYVYTYIYVYIYIYITGGILLFSKEAIINVCKKSGISDISSGLIGGLQSFIEGVVICIYLSRL
jgi:predicted ThiF/HesA family dinucleotide-utilizing enzyme